MNSNLKQNEINEFDINRFKMKYYLKFLKYIKKGKYEEAFKFFETILNLEKPNYSADSNFYLYLLNNILYLPKHYRDYAQKIKVADIVTYPNDSLRNEIRIEAFRKNFSLAIQKTKELNTTEINDIISLSLLIYNCDVNKKNKRKVLELIEAKRYKQAINYLEQKNSTCEFDKLEIYSLKLLHKIRNIIENNIKPTTSSIKTSNIYYAIEEENYELALSLRSYNNKFNNKEDQEDIIYLLLSDLCALIKGDLKFEHNSDDELESYKPQKIMLNKPLYEERRMAEEYHQKLLNEQGIILLEYMDYKQEQTMIDCLQRYSDIELFKIGSDKESKLVLRYKPFITEYINMKHLIKKGSLAYEQGEYDLCIKCYLRLLQIGEPRANIYAKLGLAYMKNNDKEKAITHLTVADELSKQQNMSFDFTYLVYKLKYEDNNTKKIK